MINIKCNQIYKEGRKIGEWLEDYLVHDFSIVKYDGYFLFCICSHCGVRQEKNNNIPNHFNFEQKENVMNRGEGVKLKTKRNG